MNRHRSTSNRNIPRLLRQKYLRRQQKNQPPRSHHTLTILQNQPKSATNFKSNTSTSSPKISGPLLKQIDCLCCSIEASEHFADKRSPLAISHPPVLHETTLEVSWFRFNDVYWLKMKNIDEIIIPVQPHNTFQDIIKSNNKFELEILFPPGMDKSSNIIEFLLDESEPKKI